VHTFATLQKVGFVAIFEHFPLDSQPPFVPAYPQVGQAGFDPLRVLLPPVPAPQAVSPRRAPGPNGVQANIVHLRPPVPRRGVMQTVGALGP